MPVINKLPSPNFKYNLLPSRALQPEPDGSSNPEINLVGNDQQQQPPYSLPQLDSGLDMSTSFSWNTSRIWDDNLKHSDVLQNASNINNIRTLNCYSVLIV